MNRSQSPAQRGEIWRINFNPGRGSEQQGIRPALVIQNNIGNPYAATTIVAAITSTIREYPVTVVLEKGEGGLTKKSMVNLAQLLTLDKPRLLKKIGMLSKEKLMEVNEALKVSLALDDKVSF